MKTVETTTNKVNSINKEINNNISVDSVDLSDIKTDISELKQSVGELSAELKTGISDLTENAQKSYDLILDIQKQYNSLIAMMIESDNRSRQREMQIQERLYS